MALSRTVRRFVPCRFRPTLEALEDRCTPADILGSVSHGRLSLTAVDGVAVEQIIITPNPGAPPGSVVVAGSAGTTINGNTTDEFFGIRSIRIQLRGGDDTANLSGVRLTGGLTFLGGDGANDFHLSNASRIGGSVRVVNGTNAPGSLETVQIHIQVQIGGSVIVSNGRGAVVTSLSSVRIAGRVEVTGGRDLDGLTLDSGTLVGAGLTADLGGGSNSIALLNCAVAGPVRVSGGGGGDGLILDHVLLGAGLAADLGGGANITQLVDNLVPRSIRVTGDGGSDTVHLTDTLVGRRLAALLGGGSNALTIDDNGTVDPSTSGSTVQGALTYAGGSGLDSVRIGNERPVMLVGPVTIVTGDEPGLGDFVSLDDTIVLSTLLIDTGAGSDFVRFEQNNTLLNGRTTVLGKATIRTGASNDEVRFGAAGASELKVQFAVAPAVNGGPGNSDDLFRNNYFIDPVNQAPFSTPGFENVFP